MNQLNKLSKQDIEENYLNKPILIVDSDKIKKWYIVSDIGNMIPLHMLDEEEADLYDEDESNIEGIELADGEGKGYLMWIYFGQDDGWEAFGYE